MSESGTHIALVQQAASPDRRRNVEFGLEAVARAAADGARVVSFAELAFERFHPQPPAEAGYARRLFLRDRRPGFYRGWLDAGETP